MGADDDGGDAAAARGVAHREWVKLRGAIDAISALRDASDAALLSGQAVSDYLEQAAADDVERDAIRRNEFGWLLRSPVEALDDEGLLPPRFVDLHKERSVEFVPTARGGAAAAEASGGPPKVTDREKRRLLPRWLRRRLVTDVAPQARAFAEGLRAVVPAGALALFDAAELQALLGGGPRVDDAALADWQAHAAYDGFDAEHECARWFWAAVAAMAAPRRADVWRFATGRAAPPPLLDDDGDDDGGGGGGGGCATSEPRFNLVLRADCSDGLVVARTCFAQLALPRYTSAARLAAALERSVDEGLAAAQASPTNRTLTPTLTLTLNDFLYPAAQGEPDSFEALQRRLQAAVHAAATRAEADGGAADLQAALRQPFPNAYQCARCGFGPVDHFACQDLRSHHGEAQDGGAAISNACPECGWFSANLADWPRWDGAIKNRR